MQLKLVNIYIYIYIHKYLYTYLYNIYNIHTHIIYTQYIHLISLFKHIYIYIYI